MFVSIRHDSPSVERAAQQSLIAAVRSPYRLSWEGIHGFAHGERVRENDLRLAESTGARADVVELFAYFHDACRLNDGRDPDHGPRGAELARRLAGSACDRSLRR